METSLSVWESFYVIVGTSGAALTGLQFVVVALIAEGQAKSSERAIAAFGTPTIVHFATVLLISSILSAPWKGLAGPSITIAALGAGGVCYAALTAWRARTSEYEPVMEDWIWHVILPFASHLTMLIAGLLMRRYSEVALFAVGGVALMLVTIGLHNAWDTVTFIALRQAQGLPLVGPTPEPTKSQASASQPTATP
jgi:hypothetical protein